MGDLVDPVERVLSGAAGWLLDGAPDIDGSLSPDWARSLVWRARAEGLLGPVVAVVDAGVLVLPGDVADELRKQHHRAMVWCVTVEARLLEVREWFAAGGGVEHRVLKGPAVAHLDEPEPWLRSFADLDLLVAAEDLDRAVEVLIGRGATRPWAQRRPGYDRRFAKSVTLTFPDGVEVDLHRSLCDGVHGFRIPMDRVFAGAETFALGDEAVPALDPVHRLLHAAYHAVLGSPMPPLRSLRDLAGYLTTPGLDPDVVVPEVQRWRGEAVLATAVDDAFGALTFAAPAWRAWADAQVVDPVEQRRIVRQRHEGSSYGWAKIDALRELPGVRDRLAFAAAMALPSGAHLRSRGRRRRDPLAKAARRARRAAGRRSR